MKRLLITICGRAGSKGFKNKNLKKLHLQLLSVRFLTLFILNSAGI